MVFPLCLSRRFADATGVFGSHLVGKGRITQHQLLETLELQQKSRIPLGRMAFQRGYLTIDQVVDVLERQTAEGGAFGEIAIAAGYLSPGRRDELLSLQKRTTRRLGELLVESGYLDPEVVEAELAEYEAARDASP